MKNLTLLFTAILLSLATMAQVPGGINYQTVIRDGDGNILEDTELSLQMSIRSGAPDGAVVYQETHDATTNAFGLVNLVIGYGVPLSNAFADINWGDGEKYLEVAIDLDGSGSYTILGVTQFLSVPYAMFSQKAATVKDGASPGEMLYWNGEEWVAIPPGEHDQTLRLCNGVPTWGVCQYNLILISDPVEAGTVTGQGHYEADEQVNITADANPGWEFINWTDINGVASDVANFNYTMPAEDITLTANFINLQIGEPYQGGIVAYILQPGDPGYIEGEVHGLIAATSDQTIGTEWGCKGTAIPGADGTALGTGYQNTLDIVAGCSTAGIAAQICNDLELNDYNDWHLPSKDELNKLYINRGAIGGFVAYDCYWSSSEYSNIYAWGQYFNNGGQYDVEKSFYYGTRIRAVRAF